MPWIYGNFSLNQTQMENNARLVWAYFAALKWTPNAVAGMLGNMQGESTINPGRWQGGVVNPEGGFGLVQWTPATKWFSWANARGYDTQDGHRQCERIEWERKNGVQFFPTSQYPMTFTEFSQSNLPPAELASAFLYNYERPLDPTETEVWRRNRANDWYTFITGMPVPSVEYTLPFIFWHRRREWR